jgi:hypothetical protein
MKPDLALRSILTIAGALAGLSAWLIAEQLPQMIDNIRGLMALGVFAGLLFSVFMVATGPLRPLAALIAALAVAVPATLLFLWASFRHSDAVDFIESGLPVVALLFGAGIAVPFVITALARRGNWSDYATLFTEAWYIFTRTTAAMVFMGLVWAVILLSDQMMQLVGLSFVDDILKIDAVPAMITGAALGIALAVVHELSAYVTPYLILRLLRLLLPLVLVVSAVFVVAMPFRGLNELNAFFGSLSAGFVLMAMAFGGLTLVTVAIDQKDEDAVAPGWMQWATKALALLTPLLAALAVWSVSLRVGQYGWTPQRLAAMTAALVLLGYGIGYTMAVVRRDWMHRIRRANVWMALATMVIAALWLTPVLNAQRISANSQVARFETGRIGVAELDVWPLTQDWGHAGDAAIERLRALNHPEQVALNARIDKALGAKSKFDYNPVDEPPEPEPTKAEMAAAVAAIDVLPKGAVLPAIFSESTKFYADTRNLCVRQADGGANCIIVIGNFDKRSPEDEYLLLSTDTISDTTSDYGAQYVLYSIFRDLAVGAQSSGYFSNAAFVSIRSGNFSIEPSPFQVLITGDTVIDPSD